MTGGSGPITCAIVALDRTLTTSGTYSGSSDATYTVEIVDDTANPNSCVGETPLVPTRASTHACNMAAHVAVQVPMEKGFWGVDLGVHEHDCRPDRGAWW